MEDSRIFRIRNGLLVSFTLLALVVMWANVIGLSGALSIIVHVLLVINVGGALYFVRKTGFGSLGTTPLPFVLLGLLVAASVARFIYAWVYFD